MRIRILILSFILSGLALPGPAMGLDNHLGRFFAQPHQAKHRLVAKLMCEEPVTTFLAVMSLHGSKTNAATVVLTDAEGLQTTFEEVLQTDRPLRLSCEQVPVEFSQDAPVFVHVDSRHATRGIALHVLRESPPRELGWVELESAPLDF